MGVMHSDATANLLEVAGAPSDMDLLHTKISMSIKYAAMSAKESSKAKSTRIVHPAVTAECVSRRNRTKDIAFFFLEWTDHCRTVAAEHNIPYRKPAISLVDCDVAQLKAIVCVFGGSEVGELTWYKYHNMSMEAQLQYDLLLLKRNSGMIKQQEFEVEVSALHGNAHVWLGTFICHVLPSIPSGEGEQ